MDSFCPSLLEVSLLFVSAPIACCPFTSGTAAAASGRAVVTELMARLWQSQQGSSSLHQIKAPAAAQRDAERMSMRCRGGDSFQASCRQLELCFTTAEPWLPTSPMAMGTGLGLPAARGASPQLEIARGKTTFSQTQVSHLEDLKSL